MSYRMTPVETLGIGNQQQMITKDHAKTIIFSRLHSSLAHLSPVKSYINHTTNYITKDRVRCQFDRTTALRTQLFSLRVPS